MGSGEVGSKGGDGGPFNRGESGGGEDIDIRPPLEP